MGDPNKIKTLYDGVSKDYDIGTFEEFTQKLADPVKRKAFYDGVGSEYDLGDYADFELKVSATPIQKKNSLASAPPTESSQDIPVVSLTDSQVQSEPLAEQPTPLGEKSGVEAKPYIDEETAGARTLLEKQIKSDVTKSGIKPVNKFELVNEKDRIEKEASKNYNIVDNNFRFGQVKQLKGLYDTLEQAKQGIGVTTDVKGLQQRIDDLRNQPVEMQMGVDSNGQQIPKAKSPYKTVGEMFDATIKAHNDFSVQKQKAQEIDNTLQPLIKEARDINKYKVTQKDEQGNEYYGMNPMESFMNAFDSSIDHLDIAMKNISGNRQAAKDAMERKWVNENVLYPQRPQGAISTATGMLGGVAPLILGGAIAPEGAGALAVNALLFGAGDYGGTLYQSYTDARSKGLNTEDAFNEAESNARFAGGVGATLGATMPLQGMAGRKVFLNGAEAGAFKSFLAEQGGMIPAFGTSTALKNWYEGKPISDGVGQSMVDAFIIGGMTHAITAIPNLPSKTKTVFENTIAKNYEALAPALNKIAEQGLISPETIKNIAEKSRAFKVVGKETPPSVEEKIIDKGVELNKVSDEISAIKKENPLAEPTELIQKAERLNREINEEKGVPLTSDERTEYAKLIEKRDQKVEKGEKKVELTEPEKEDLRHYEARIEKAKKLEEEAKTEAQKIKEANEEISKRAIELEPTITEPKTETDAIQERSTEEILSRQREGVSQEGGERSGMGQGDKGKEVAGKGEAEKVTEQEITLFKGQIGKLNPDGTRRTAHPNAEGFFASESEEAAKRYSGEDKPQKVVLPKGVTVEEAEVADKNKPMSEIRREEERLINESKAQIVKLKTIDAQGEEVQYIVKDKSLLGEKPAEAKVEEKVEPTVEPSVEPKTDVSGVGEVRAKRINKIEGAKDNFSNNTRALIGALNEYAENVVGWTETDGSKISGITDSGQAKFEKLGKGVEIEFYNPSTKTTSKYFVEGDANKIIPFVENFVKERQSIKEQPTTESTSQIFDRAFEAIKQRKKMAERDKILDEYGDKADKAKFVFKNWDKIKENLKQRAKEYEIEFKGDC